jgi:hypothetical protein
VPSPGSAGPQLARSERLDDRTSRVDTNTTVAFPASLMTTITERGAFLHAKRPQRFLSYCLTARCEPPRRGVRRRLRCAPGTAVPSPWITVTTDVWRPRLVVVGVDGSDSSRGALRWAGRVCAGTGAKIMAVTCWTYPVNYGYAFPDHSGQWDPAADATQELSTEVKSAFGDDVPPGLTTLVRRGHPAEVLVELSEDGPAGGGLSRPWRLRWPAPRVGQCALHRTCRVPGHRHASSPAAGRGADIGQRMTTPVRSRHWEFLSGQTTSRWSCLR